MSKNPVISIIILNYNTKKLLKACLKSLEKVKKEVNFEVIVSDNGSTDGSLEMIKNEFPQVVLVENKENLGFSAGNNAARKVTKGKYVLFLNSDTEVKKGTLKYTLELLEKNPKLGAVTCKMILADGTLDKDARRSFPTPWVSFTHLVLPLDRIFPDSPLFSRYWYGYVDPNKEHSVEVIQGAYFLSRKQLLDRVGWFDEDYFLDGEDIDLSWKIKEQGYELFYTPKVSIMHYKGATKGKNKAKEKIPVRLRLKYRLTGINSMEIFYKKRLWSHYPLFLNVLVLAGIKLLKLIRITKEIIT